MKGLCNGKTNCNDGSDETPDVCNGKKCNGITECNVFYKHQKKKKKN